MLSQTHRWKYLQLPLLQSTVHIISRINPKPSHNFSLSPPMKCRPSSIKSSWKATPSEAMYFLKHIQKNSFYFYSNKEVAEYIESETSFHCIECGEVHETINLLKKHLNNSHRLQFWYFYSNSATSAWTTEGASSLSNDSSLMASCKFTSNKETLVKLDRWYSIILAVIFAIGDSMTSKHSSTTLKQVLIWNVKSVTLIPLNYAMFIIKITINSNAISRRRIIYVTLATVLVRNYRMCLPPKHCSNNTSEDVIESTKAIRMKKYRISFWASIKPQKRTTSSLTVSAAIYRNNSTFSKGTRRLTSKYTMMN